MKNKKKIDNCSGTLEEDLQSLLKNADELIGEKLPTVDLIIDKLLIINSDCSNKLASNIINIKKEIDTINDYKNFSYEQNDNPFLTLHSDDDEY